MEPSEIADFLAGRGVRPTPNRILVLRELIRSTSPVSLADLEVALESVDQASIFRTLDLFASKEIIHIINDGSRALKYELCHGHHHSIADEHVHFVCEKCGRVYCFEKLNIPLLALPDGFMARSANFIYKGICPRCAGSDI